MQWPVPVSSDRGLVPRPSVANCLWQLLEKSRLPKLHVAYHFGGAFNTYKLDEKLKRQQDHEYEPSLLQPIHLPMRDESNCAAFTKYLGRYVV